MMDTMRELDKLLESTDIDDLLEMDLDQFSESELEYLFNKVQNKADGVCYQLGIDYNMRDVQLVDLIDKQTGLMELALTIAYKGGVNYPEVFGTTAIWDSITYRYLSDKKIAVPQNEVKAKGDYPGGYVKDPHVGMSEWVTSFDLNSLYPNLIVQYNMSPETLLTDPADRQMGGVEYYLRDDVELPADVREKDVAVAANGTCYRKDKQGFIPELIVGLYDERRVTKKKMLEVKSELEKIDEVLKSRGVSV